MEVVRESRTSKIATNYESFVKSNQNLVLVVWKKQDCNSEISFFVFGHNGKEMMNDVRNYLGFAILHSTKLDRYETYFDIGQP